MCYVDVMKKWLSIQCLIVVAFVSTATANPFASKKPIYGPDLSIERGVPTIMEDGKIKYPVIDKTTGNRVYVEMERIPKKWLEEGRPSLLKRMTMGTLQTLHTFPFETARFYTVMGTMAAYKALANYEKDPMALKNFMDSLKDPIGYISFFGFMLANRGVAAMIQPLAAKKFSPKVAGFLAGNLGMAAGMTVSNAIHDVVYAKDLQACAFSYFKDIEACDRAFEDVVINEKYVQYTSSVTSLLAAAMLNTQVRRVGPDALKLVQKNTRIRMVSQQDIREAKTGVDAVFKKLGFHGLRFEYLAKSGSRWIPGLGFIVNGIDIGIFLGLAEAFDPFTHYASYNLMQLRSNHSELLTSKNRIYKTLDALGTYDWHYGTCENKNYNPLTKQTTFEKTLKGNESYMSRLTQKTNEMCTSNAAGYANGYGLLSHIEKFRKSRYNWNQNLIYDSQMQHGSWMGFLSQLLVANDVSKKMYLDVLSEVKATIEDPNQGSNLFKETFLDRIQPKVNKDIDLVLEKIGYLRILNENGNSEYMTSARLEEVKKDPKLAERVSLQFCVGGSDNKKIEGLYEAFGGKNDKDRRRVYCNDIRFVQNNLEYYFTGENGILTKLDKIKDENPQLHSRYSKLINNILSDLNADNYYSFVRGIENLESLAKDLYYEKNIFFNKYGVREHNFYADANFYEKYKK
ncbi:hypothetical protein N9W41_00720, partial [bacterium]|nr:hypothetical protein [bacterium]